jgi:hypothetical protein
MKMTFFGKPLKQANDKDVLQGILNFKKNFIQNKMDPFIHKP